MKYTIQSKQDHVSEVTKKQMKKYLHDFDFVEDEENPDLVVSIGGDGTLLEAFHRYQHRLAETAFVGVHTGHLGFYADWLAEEIEKLVIAIATKPSRIIEYPLLEATIQFHDKTEERYIALNEVTVRRTSRQTLVVDVKISGKHFETFRGDGLCISTPSGSTAYNKSLGGAILHPDIEAFQVTEIASINNRVFRTVGSSLILPKNQSCTIRPKENADFYVTLDHRAIDETNVRAIKFAIADEKIRFARFRSFPFWNRVHSAFISDEPMKERGI